jgi:serine protease AprX
VIAVGATDPQGTKKVGDDTAATFSSGGDNVRNPDILAPGTSLQGLRVPGSFADVHFGTTAAFGDRFIRGSGTSQATAIVSGAAAIVLSHRPHLTPDQVKAVLTRGAVKLPKVRDAAQGRGILNISRALGGRDPLVIQAWKRSSGLGSIVESGGTWVDPNWSGGTWSGGTWSGGTWSGGTWSGNTWSGNTWSGNTWSSAGWN